MKHTKDALILSFRIMTGCYLMATAYFVAGPRNRTHGIDLFGRDLVTSQILSHLLALLLLWCGCWILLGLRTRVVAVICVTLLTSIMIIKGDTWNEHAMLRNEVITSGVISMLALSVVGGGRFSLFSAGWRDISL